MLSLQFDPYLNELRFVKISTSVITGGSAQINSQVLSQNWDLSSGNLSVYSPLDVNSYTFTVEDSAILEID